jgi:MerR family transcriptional regulator, copper efflux regulator
MVAAGTTQGDELMTQALTIGQLSRATGVAAKTIRYYEQIGLLPIPSRTAAGYRQYDQPSVQRLRFIRRARSLGLPLREVKTVIVRLDGRPRSALRPRLLAVVRRQLSALQDQSAELRKLQQQLEQVLHRLSSSPPVQHREGCRCLEIEGAGDHLSRKRIPHTRTPRKVDG